MSLQCGSQAKGMSVSCWFSSVLVIGFHLLSFQLSLVSCCFLLDLQTQLQVPVPPPPPHTQRSSPQQEGII